MIDLVSTLLETDQELHWGGGSVATRTKLEIQAFSISPGSDCPLKTKHLLNKLLTTLQLNDFTMKHQILEALQFLSTPEKRDFLPYFFKTGKGQYAEGDQFIGVVVPDSRKLVKEYWQKASLDDVQEILKSEFHEMRLVALMILVTKFEKSKDEKEKKNLVDFYLKNTK